MSRIPGRLSHLWLLLPVAAFLGNMIACLAIALAAWIMEPHHVWALPTQLEMLRFSENVEQSFLWTLPPAFVAGLVCRNCFVRTNSAAALAAGFVSFVITVLFALVAFFALRND